MRRLGVLFAKAGGAAALVASAIGIFYLFSAVQANQQSTTAASALAPTVTAAPTIRADAPLVIPTLTPIPTVPPNATPTAAPTSPVRSVRPTESPIVGPIRLSMDFLEVGYVPNQQSKMKPDAIFLGRITSIGPAFWNTPERKRPVPFVRSDFVEKTTHRIYTPISIQIQQTFLSPPGTTITGTFALYQLGGQVGEDWMRIEGIPTFAVSERVMVFLVENRQLQAIRPDPVTRWLPLDRYVITRDGQAKGQVHQMTVDELFIRTEALLGHRIERPTKQ